MASPGAWLELSMVSPEFRRDGDQVFDAEADFYMERPVSAAQAKADLDAARPTAQALWKLTNHMFRNDRVWPPEPAR